MQRIVRSRHTGDVRRCRAAVTIDGLPALSAAIAPVKRHAGKRARSRETFLEHRRSPCQEAWQVRGARSNASRRARPVGACPSRAQLRTWTMLCLYRRSDRRVNHPSQSGPADFAAMRHHVAALIDSRGLLLPPLPGVAAEVMASSLDDDADTARLAQLIQTDQGLAGHVLRVVNSPAMRLETVGEMVLKSMTTESGFAPDKTEG